MASKPAEARREAWADSLSKPSEGMNPADLDLRLLASRTGRQYLSVIEAIQYVVLCYSSHSKLIHGLNPRMKLGDDRVIVIHS